MTEICDKGGCSYLEVLELRIKALFDYGKSKRVRKDFEEEERQANWEVKSARQQVDFSIVKAS